MKSALIIGGGAAGCAAAHQLRQREFSVTILERSGELGAGVRTYTYAGHPYTFGPRHFLTQNEKIWAWMDALCPLRRCGEHEFWSFVPEDGNFYNFPINMADIDWMPDREQIKTQLTFKIEDEPVNLEQFWRFSVGDNLYGKLIKRYTEKMWQMPCEALDTFKWSPKGSPIKDGPRAAWTEALSGYPIAPDGYNQWFDKCVDGCNVILNADIQTFDLDKKKIITKDAVFTYDVLVNTISPDILFGKCYGELPYIGRDFHKIVLPVEFALPENVYWIYEAATEPWTRLTEFKKMTKHQSPFTLLGLEIPSNRGKHYPIPTKQWQGLARRYHALMPANVYSIGRAGSYRYSIDIAGCIEQAMDMAQQIDGGWQHPVPCEKFRT